MPATRSGLSRPLTRWISGTAIEPGVASRMTAATATSGPLSCPSSGGGDLAGGEAGQPGEHASDEEPAASRVSGFARGRLGGFVAVGCGAPGMVRAAFDRHRTIVAHAP